MFEFQKSVNNYKLFLGGIEELEKQLKIKNSSISSRIGDSTTESTIGKSLFERLKALKNTENGKKNM